METVRTLGPANHDGQTMGSGVRNLTSKPQPQLLTNNVTLGSCLSSYTY